MGFAHAFVVILSLFSLCSAVDYNIKFDTLTLPWVNCYDTATCTTWQACPLETAAQVCLKFAVKADAQFVDSNDYSIGHGRVENAFLITTMKQQSSYTFDSAQTTEAPSTTWTKTPYVRTPNCISQLDTYLDPSCPTTNYFKTNNIQDLPSSHRCLAAFQGYGSVYNTICEPYASRLSSYYTINEPTTPVFTDFGTPRATKSLGCYYENWAKYRPAPYKADITFLQGCDIVYFFVNVLADRSGNIALVEREEGDWATITSIKTTYPTAEVVLTFGGWTSNNTIMYQAMTSHKTDLLPQILALSDRLDIGIDFDVEFPGSSNGLADVFPSDFPTITSFMKELCDHLHNNNRRCFWGGLGVGTHYFEELILALAQTSGVDQFNMFGYDLHGPWESTMEHQNILRNARGVFPNYTLEATVENFRKILPISQLSLGFPLYARGALVTSTGTVISAWPTASPMLGPGESGSDLIITKDGVEGPAIYDPNTDTITSDVSGYFVLTRKVGANYGKLYFSNSTTFAHINYELRDSGLTSYFTYASSMNKEISPKLNQILKSERKSRSLQSLVYYQFPSTGATQVQCPNIVAYSDNLIATLSTYEGCHVINSASTLCFYKTSDFTCSPGTTKTVMTPSSDSCLGLNSNTLLPSTEADVSIVCPDLTLSQQQVSICPEPVVPSSPVIVEIQVPSSISTWPHRTIPINTEFVTKTQAIELPYACDNITQLPTCKEMLCGADSTCYTLVSTPAMTEFCNTLGFHIQTYNQAVQQFKTEHADMTYLFDELSMVAVTKFGSQTAVTQRDRRSLAVIGAGFGILGSILGVVGIGIGVKNTIDIANLRDDLMNVQVTSENNFNAIKVAFDDFQDSTVAALKEQSNINAAFDTNFKNMQEFVTDNFNSVNTKFTELDGAIRQVVSAVNDLADDVDRQKIVTASSGVSSIRVATAIDLLTSNRLSVISTTSQLRTCLASLRASSLAGCVPEGSDSIPLSVKSYTTGSTKGLLFLYMTRRTVGSLTLQSTTSFCNGTILYTAASDCFFYINDTVIQHTNSEFQTCPPPIEYPIDECPSSMLQLTPQQHTVQLDFTSIPVFQPKPPQLNVSLNNFTLTDLGELIGYNATAFDSLVNQIDSLQLELQSLKPPTSSGFTTYQILTISALSLGIFGTLIGFFSTFYSCNLKQFLFKNR